MKFSLRRSTGRLSCVAAIVLSTGILGNSEPLDSEQSALLRLINSYRAQNGANPLRISAALVNASQWMSNDLASKNYLGHTDSLGRDPFTRMAAFGYPYSPSGENIGAGYSDAQNTFNQWITACDPDSSGNCTYAHRQNLLNSAYQVIGIGRAGNNNSTYRWYWTADLGGFVDKSDGRGNRPPDPALPAGGAAGAGAITYHGGPLILGTTHIYYIWYGNWSVDPNANAIVTAFANNIGGSPYFNINTTYYDAANAKVSNSVAFAGSTSDIGSLGTSLSDANIWTIVSNAFAGGFPVDPNGVYFVLTAPGVAETSGFISSYCGWHDYQSYSGTPIKYAFVGDAAGPKLSSCAQQTTTSPNGDPAVDGMISVIAHELEESVTDPQLNAWYDSKGNENADKCAWTFGTQYAVANGSLANMRLGTMDFLIQQNWLNVGSGSCALSYGPDFSLSVSPASQSVLQGSTTANYTITVNPLNGYSGSVTLSVVASSLPAGATASAVSSSSTFTVSVGATVPPGTYQFAVSGTDGTLNHTASASLVVTLPVAVAPQFSPPAGSYTSSQSVIISTTTAGASIRYTTNGTNPTETTGTLYNNNPVTVSSTATLKAIAYKTGMTDSSVASAAYTIAPTYTVTASPSSVAAGGNLSVSWTASSGASATDWIALFPVGSANTAYGWWQYTNGSLSGTFNLTAPAQAGQYEFRYLLQNGYTDVVRSSAVTVTPPGPVISSVQTSNILSTAATITWTTDVPADSQVDYGTTTSYNSSSTLNSTLVTTHSVTLTGLTASLGYHFRVKSKNSSGTLSMSGDFTFTTAASGSSTYTLTPSPSSVAPGGNLSVSWTAPAGASATDWIALFPVGAANTGYGWWQYTNGALSGTFNLTAPAQTGQYEFRYLPLNGYTDVARSSTVTVTGGGPVISAVLANNILSSATTITWTTDVPADSQVEYGTTTGYGSSSTLNAALVSAHSVNLTGLVAQTLYHFHVKSKNSSGTLSASGDFVFTTATGSGTGYILAPSLSTVALGGNLSVSWTAPSGSSATDWIGLFPAGSPNTSYGWWQFTNGALSGTFNLTAPTQTGQYEFRYLLQDGYIDVVRSSVVTVH